ncbi:hypothetical protein ACNKHV_06930 [Shigella flexneri]
MLFTCQTPPALGKSDSGTYIAGRLFIDESTIKAAKWRGFFPVGRMPHPGPQNPQIQLIASLAGLISVVYQAMLAALESLQQLFNKLSTTWLAGP